MHGCATGREGAALTHEYALRTESLVPAHTFVPWVTLNGRHDDDIQTRAMDDLVKLVCDTYKGKYKPKECFRKTSWFEDVNIAVVY